jgi:hypothetical protein
VISETQDGPEQEQAPKKPEVLKGETRIDEYAVSMFQTLGYDPDKLPDSLVSIYQELKLRKDRLYPGRMSPEGLAIVALLADVQDGKVSLNVGGAKKK